MVINRSWISGLSLPIRLTLRQFAGFKMLSRSLLFFKLKSCAKACVLAMLHVRAALFSVIRSGKMD